MEEEKDSPVVKLARIVRESGSYEEFLLRAKSDEEASDLLDRLSAHWAGLYGLYASAAAVPGLYRVLKRHADKATDRA